MDEFAASLSIPPKTSVLKSIEGINLFNFDSISIIRNVLFSNETKQNKVFTLLQTKIEGSTDTFHCAGVNVPNFMETGKPSTLFPDAKFCLFPSPKHEKKGNSRATILKKMTMALKDVFSMESKVKSVQWNMQLCTSYLHIPLDLPRRKV
jgi:hypothetical protein